MRKIEEKYEPILIEKVFIHELGHYIANKINHKNGQTVGPKAIIFYPCEANDLDLCGCTDRDSLDPIIDMLHKDRFGYNVGRLIMGCVFQSYYLVEGIGGCLTQNGHNDNWELRILKNNFAKGDIFKLAAISNSELQFLKTLKEERDLDFLYKLKPLDFIGELQDDGKWYVDLEKLENRLEELGYKSFESKYINYVSELNAAI